ncbi:hypothetical protein [uncultured Methanobrevibacter sp.]|uniref:hypothetical protein n=1 Tax=uncultured Methanobrevibacter sp. TaxID=253161 RepID=UPI0025DCF857|nr:hypothetical protein [uncultured Methanobrevibacter sp.]
MCEKDHDEMAYGLIETIFGDFREIDGKASDEIQSISKKHKIEADIYKTKNNELISYGLTNEDFGNEELEKYKEYGEELYEKSGKEVCIYILGSPHIKFNATNDFETPAKIKINISLMEYSSTYETLRHIKSLVENRQKLDSEDLFALKMIPTMGPPEDKRFLRIECLKLWKTIVNKRLIK